MVGFEIPLQPVKHVPLSLGGFEAGHIKADGVLRTASFVHDGLGDRRGGVGQIKFVRYGDSCRGESGKYVVRPWWFTCASRWWCI